MLDRCIWIVLQVCSLIIVFVIILLVSWVTNGDFRDVLTKCRILETVNAEMTCAMFDREVSQVGPDCACLNIFFIVYLVVPSKVKAVIRHFGKNPLTEMFWKQRLFCWSMFLHKGKCENPSENFLKDLICRRKKYISLKEVESVIVMFCVIRCTVLSFALILFLFYVGKIWVIILLFPLTKLLTETMVIFLLFSFVSFHSFLIKMKNFIFGLSCESNVLLSWLNYLAPQCYEKGTCCKLEVLSLSFERHDEVELFSSNVMRERYHLISKESGVLIDELGMRMKGDGHEKRGGREMGKERKVRGKSVKQCRELGSGLGGGGGGGCGRDDEDDVLPNQGLEDEEAEDSSHEEEVSEREPVEPIDNYFHPLPNIFYIPTNVPGPGANVEDFESAFQGCFCAVDGNGCCWQKCLCVQRSMGLNYDSQGSLLPEKLSGNIPVFECGEYCDCSIDCGNRKVQFGPLTELTIFETTTNADILVKSVDDSIGLQSNHLKCTGKGLGLRTQKPVSKGSFICEYAGEIIGKEEAFKRWRYDYVQGHPNYILSLQEWISQSQSRNVFETSCLDTIQALDQVKSVDSIKTEEHFKMSQIVTYIDPTRMGNIGRYANHSCDPNAIAVTVRVGCPVPRLCLFAAKDLMPGEEVIFDYVGLQVGLTDEIVDASSPSKLDHQLEKQSSSSSAYISPDSHSEVLEESCKKTSDDVNVSVDGIIEGTLSKRLKFHEPLPEEEDSTSKDHELDHRRTLCLCGTKKCRKYLPFSKNWM